MDEELKAIRKHLEVIEAVLLLPYADDTFERRRILHMIERRVREVSDREYLEETKPIGQDTASAVRAGQSLVD